MTKIDITDQDLEKLTDLLFEEKIIEAEEILRANEVPDDDKVILLFAMIMHNKPKSCSLLIDNRTNPKRFLTRELCAAIERGNFEGFTPIHIAAAYGNEAIAEMLITHTESDIEVQNPYNQRTPIFYAAKFGNLEMYNFLIENGANASQVDNKIRSPIFAAVEGLQLDICELFLKREISASSVDCDRNTLLMVAANGPETPDKRRLGICEMLLARGANPDAENSEQKTALMLAQESDNSELCDLLGMSKFRTSTSAAISPTSAQSLSQTKRDAEMSASQQRH